MFIIHLCIFLIIMYLAQMVINRIFPEPAEDSDAAFLAMCCRRLETNIENVFLIAAENAGLKLPSRFILKDVKLFLHGETEVPFYVRKFIDDGKKALGEDTDETD